MEVMWIIILAFIGWAIYELLTSKSDIGPIKAYASREDAFNEPHPFSSGQVFNQEIVGESHYQEALSGIVQNIPAGYEYVQAQLEMENNNPHDRNAVAVKIAGHLIGYLPREAAKEYRSLAKEEGLPAITTCPAVIKGGGDRSYGVWLGLPELV
jgi:hypothetical protein